MLYRMVSRRKEAVCAAPNTCRLTAPPQRCGMAKKEGHRSSRYQEVADDRQDQRPRRHAAEDGWGHGEGVQLLRQPGHVVARVFASREPRGRSCCRCSEAARRTHGEIPCHDEPAEPGTGDGPRGTATVDRIP